MLDKKNSTQDLFDVPMGSYHEAEICELVGLYTLHDLTEDKKNKLWTLPTNS